MIDLGTTWMHLSGFLVFIVLPAAVVLLAARWLIVTAIRTWHGLAARKHL